MTEEEYIQNFSAEILPLEPTPEQLRLYKVYIERLKQEYKTSRYAQEK